MTAGKLSERTGLAPASVTGLVDRLVQKGAARRIPHPGDGRKVLIEFDPGWIEKVGPLYAGIMALMTDIVADYTDDQLAAIADFLERSSEGQLKLAQDLGRQLSDR